MEENLKKLLLKDLCSRLPYKVKCKYSGEIPMIGEVTNNIGVLSNIHVDKDCPFEINGGIYGFADVKPYLRPMSSMTDEEKKEYSKTLLIIDGHYPFYTIDTFDYLLSRHFDVHGLISKGLALEAPKDMYNIND